MSWLNNSLNTIKGQLSTLAHEILEETAGPGDTEYRGPPVVDNRTAVEMLADMQRDKEELDKLCSDKEQEIVALRKQIEILQNQSDTGGGGSKASGSIGATGSGRTSKSPTDNNATALEDSWCWEPDNVKSDNDHCSESSSGNGNEMVNITLEEVPLGASAKSGNKTKLHRLGKANDGELIKRLQHLEEENKQLSNSLEELDTQHNVAMQNLLGLKTDLQEKLSKVTQDYEAFKNKQEQRFKSHELEMAHLKSLNESLEKEKQQSIQDNQELKKNLLQSSEEIKQALVEMADLQTLLEKKSLDNKELIERIKESQAEASQEKDMLNEKVEMLSKELEELKSFKMKKTSESSQSSSGKQSEDEFIVVREQDAHSSVAATPPPTKEELKDRIVQLENRLSEMTLENGSLSLKLHDRDMEKDLAVKVLKENMQTLQTENDELNEKLRMSLIDLEDQQFKIQELKEKACEAVIAQEQLKHLHEDKLKIANEVAKLKESFKNSLELEKRLLLSEQEKEVLQLEMQSLKTELEQKIQKLTYENQHLILNAEAETETLNNNNELEQKLKDLSNENQTLKAELERCQQPKQQCVTTDLDDDDHHEEETFDWEKLQKLIKTLGDTNELKDLSSEEYDQVYKNLKTKLSKMDNLQNEMAHMSAELMELQDSKLLWDHEKKTLEADISQYILQCDELMKNNEILLNELENYKRNKLETIPENNEENIIQLECQLDECNKLNRTLEQEYIELNMKIEEMEKENQCLNEKLRAAQQNAEALITKEKDLNLQVETLELEKCNLLLKLNDIDSKIEEDHKHSELLRANEEKAQSLEKQLNALAKDHADLVSAMQKQKESLMEAIQSKEETEKILRDRDNVLKKQHEAFEEAQKLSDSLKSEVERLNQELEANNIAKDSLKDEIKTLQLYVEQAESVMEDKFLLQEQIEEKSKALEEHKEQLENLKISHDELQSELESFRIKTKEDFTTATKNITNEHLVHITRIAELESELLIAKKQNEAYEELETISNDLKSEVDRLKQELTSNSIVCESLKEEIKILQLKAGEAQSALEDKLLLQEQIAEKSKALEEHKEQLNNLKISQDELQKELESFRIKTKEDLKTATDTITTGQMAYIADLENELLIAKKQSEAYGELEKLSNALKSEVEKLQQELMANNIVNNSLKEEIETLKLRAEEAEWIMENKLLLQVQIEEKSKALEENKEKLENLQKSQLELQQELESYRTKTKEDFKTSADAIANVQTSRIAELEKELLNVKEQNEIYKETEKIAISLKSEVDRLQQELAANNFVNESLKDEIKVLQLKVEESEIAVNEKALLLDQIQVKSKDLEEHKQQLESLKKSQDELLHELESLRIKTKEDFKTAATNITADNLIQMSRIAELEKQLLETADLQKSVDTLNFEKQEMIKALQQKHAENMQYYKEIQRLTLVVQQQQLSMVEQKPCEKCPPLQVQIVDMRKEHEKFQDQINFLKEKSDILTTNLLTEQTNQKLVQQEKADVMEQNANLRKDVERLRAHLLEIEDIHTQESVEMQKELEETKSRMMSLEEEVAKSSKTYTSASIRANQHAETLQAQYSLLVQQRDELLQKLSLAEDRDSKNQAALTNLQCALEQFQNDKENDIKLETQRIRKELQQHLDKESQLQGDIQQLQQQLADATQGLNAASRLTDQLESCQQTINVLREEVESLKQQNSVLELKLSSTESSQSDKIEKSLIKSLLIGYVVSANPNDKQQILRMISSVLDFSQGETDKVGLNKQQGGWLGSLLGSGSGQAGTHSKDNLVQAFVQFLEKESQPQQQQMPTLLNITHSSVSSQTVHGTPSSESLTSGGGPASRRTSNSSIPSAPAPVPIQPLLLNSTVLDEFVPSRNSSSILKDILSDS